MVIKEQGNYIFLIKKGKTRRETMNKMVKKLFAVVFFLVGSILYGSEYPSKQVNMIIHAGAGGTSDTIARAVGGKLQEQLGVPVISQNKTGGSGAVAMQFVKNSKADGYTIMYMPVEIAMLNPLGISKVKPEDFTLLGQANMAPASLTVRKDDTRFKTIEEFIKYAKEHPKKLKVGTAGTGSTWTYAAKELAKKYDLEFIYVPYDGGAPATMALLGKEVDFITNTPNEYVSNLDKLNVLGLMEKHPEFPELKTFKEQGYDIEFSAWGGFAAPKNISPEVKKVLEENLREAINSPEIKNLLTQRKIVWEYKNSEDFTKFVNGQYDAFEKLIKDKK